MPTKLHIKLDDPLRTVVNSEKENAKYFLGISLSFLRQRGESNMRSAV